MRTLQDLRARCWRLDGGGAARQPPAAGDVRARPCAARQPARPAAARGSTSWLSVIGGALLGAARRRRSRLRRAAVLRRGAALHRRRRRPRALGTRLARDGLRLGGTAVVSYGAAALLGAALADGIVEAMITAVCGTILYAVLAFAAAAPEQVRLVIRSLRPASAASPAADRARVRHDGGPGARAGGGAPIRLARRRPAPARRAGARAAGALRAARPGRVGGARRAGVRWRRCPRRG